jgi:hypothetical protein
MLKITSTNCDKTFFPAPVILNMAELGYYHFPHVTQQDYDRAFSDARRFCLLLENLSNIVSS